MWKGPKDIQVKSGCVLRPRSHKTRRCSQMLLAKKWNTLLAVWVFTQHCKQDQRICVQTCLPSCVNRALRVVETGKEKTIAFVARFCTRNGIAGGFICLCTCLCCKIATNHVCEHPHWPGWCLFYRVCICVNRVQQSENIAILSSAFYLWDSLFTQCEFICIKDSNFGSKKFTTERNLCTAKLYSHWCERYRLRNERLSFSNSLNKQLVIFLIPDNFHILSPLEFFFHKMCYLHLCSAEIITFTVPCTGAYFVVFCLSPMFLALNPVSLIIVLRSLVLLHLLHLLCTSYDSQKNTRTKAQFTQEAQDLPENPLILLVSCVNTHLQQCVALFL